MYTYKNKYNFLSKSRIQAFHRFVTILEYKPKSIFTK